MNLNRITNSRRRAQYYDWLQVRGCARGAGMQKTKGPSRVNWTADRALRASAGGNCWTRPSSSTVMANGCQARSSTAPAQSAEPGHSSPSSRVLIPKQVRRDTRRDRVRFFLTLRGRVQLGWRREKCVLQFGREKKNLHVRSVENRIIFQILRFLYHEVYKTDWYLSINGR